MPYRDSEIVRYRNFAEGVITNVLFDLDGTLIDSADDIIECLSRAYESTFPKLTVRIDKSLIGPPLKDLVRLLTPRLNAGDVETITQQFRSYYDTSSLSRTILKESAEEILNFLVARNKKLFIVTNKPKHATLIILNNLKLTCFCDIITPDVQAGYQLSKRDMIAYLTKTWSLNRNETMMIGDTASDVYAARENGIASVIVLNGYGNKERIQQSSPEFIVDRLDSLKTIINK